MKNNNVKKNMNWMNMLVHIRGFFGGTINTAVSVRICVSQISQIVSAVAMATNSYITIAQNRARSISNFLRLFILKSRFKHQD